MFWALVSTQGFVLNDYMTFELQMLPYENHRFQQLNSDSDLHQKGKYQRHYKNL